MGKRIWLALALALVTTASFAVVTKAAGAAVIGPIGSADAAARLPVGEPETATATAAQRRANTDPRPKTVTGGLDYFHARQKADGGFGSMAATAWVILGAVASGERMGSPLWAIAGNNPFSYLQAHSHEAAATGSDVDNAPVYYARAIMAYVASGNADRVFVAGTPRIDLLAKLYGYQDLVDGSPTKGSFSPSISTRTFQSVHTTAWAILAMQSLGQGGIERFAVAEQWLAAQQRGDGGFPAQPGDASNCEDTAMAIQALKLAAGGAIDPAVITAARQFLKTNQRGGGGFPYEAGTGADAWSTSAAIQAILALGEKPDGADWTVGGHTPESALAALQRQTGAYAKRAGNTVGQLTATGWALTALRGQPFTSFPASRPAALKAFVFRPRIESASPANGARYADTHTVLIRAAYTDGSKGTGVDPQECRVYVDNIDKTKPADIGRYSLHLQLENVPDGDHTYTLEIADHAGNVTKVEHRFTVATPTPAPTPAPTYEPIPAPTFIPPATIYPTPEPTLAPTPSTTLTPSASPSTETSGSASPGGYPVAGVPVPSPSPPGGTGASGAGGSGSAAGFLGGTLLAMLPIGAAISFVVLRRREHALGAAGEGRVLKGGGSAWERLKLTLSKSKDLVKPAGR